MTHTEIRVKPSGRPPGCVCSKSTYELIVAGTNTQAGSGRKCLGETATVQVEPSGPPLGLSISFWTRGQFWKRRGWEKGNPLGGCRSKRRVSRPPLWELAARLLSAPLRDWKPLGGSNSLFPGDCIPSTSHHAQLWWKSNQYFLYWILSLQNPIRWILLLSLLYASTARSNSLPKVTKLKCPSHTQASGELSYLPCRIHTAQLPSPTFSPPPCWNHTRLHRIVLCSTEGGGLRVSLYWTDYLSDLPIWDDWHVHTGRR